MNNALVKCVISVGLLALLFLTIPAHAHSVNKSINVSAGEHSDGASSVNGSVIVGAGAVVDGDVETVNGTVRIDDDATIRDAETVNGTIHVGSGVKAYDLATVNGAIRVAENSTIDGSIEAVNGSIGLDKGSKVNRDVSNVNGEIEINGSEIGGDLSTVTGDIWLHDGAIVRGDIIVEKPGGIGWFGSNSKRVPTVVIGSGAQVDGSIRLKRKVDLYISNTAEVGGVTGEMSMADAIRFDGDKP